MRWPGMECWEDTGEAAVERRMQGIGFGSASINVVPLDSASVWWDRPGLCWTFVVCRSAIHDLTGLQIRCSTSSLNLCGWPAAELAVGCCRKYPAARESPVALFGITPKLRVPC
jgi:hypothetical protein